ncbi:hypothetical protein C8R45DRAFT_990442 [Mycena sanguinolenta]|nr:hypothetical protein C8R45DRAFT_990442 [Mycena sanguinolenta]
MASTEPSFSSSSPAPDSPSPVPTPAPVASSPAAAVAAIARRLTLASANIGFDHIFANQIALARTVFEADTIPFHLLGLSAARLLALSEVGAKKAVAESKRGVSGKGDGVGRFAPGLEYEILQADAVVLLGLTHAFSESYMGYFQCMYALNAAHSKFTKLYKTLFPVGLDVHFSSSSASSTNSPLSHTPSLASLAPASSISTSAASSWNASSFSVSTVSDELPSASLPVPAAPAPPPARSIFGRWGASTASLLSTRSAGSEMPAEGAVEMIVSRTAFGFGLFNLVFSLLPKESKRVQCVFSLFILPHPFVIVIICSTIPLSSFLPLFALRALSASPTNVKFIWLIFDMSDHSSGCSGSSTIACWRCGH